MARYGSCIDIAIETQGLNCGQVWLMYRHSDRNSRFEVRQGMAHVLHIVLETQGLKCGKVWLMYRHSDRNSRSEVRPGMAHVST